MNFEAGRRDTQSIFKLGNRIQCVRRVLLAFDVCSISLIDGQQARNHFNVESCSLSSFQFFFVFFFLYFLFCKIYRQFSETESRETSIYHPRTILLDRLGLKFRLIARFRAVALPDSEDFEQLCHPIISLNINFCIYTYQILYTITIYTIIYIL